MNGATPLGPSVAITNSAPANARPIGTAAAGRQRVPAARVPGAMRRVLQPEHQRDRGHDQRVHQLGSASSIPRRSRPNIENAVAMESARKKTHPTQTRANVASPLPEHQHRRLGVARADAFASRRRSPGPPVVQPPEHEGPRGAVPQPAEHHRDNDVHVRADLTLLRAAERDVQVVAQPAGQRHVPPTPEVLQTPRAVGPVEVLGELGTRAASRRRSRCPCTR